jgi:NTP pyrophosphatase (non-canonical NTP hydrolase)
MNNNAEYMVRRRAFVPTNLTRREHISMGAMGLAGESGELIDILKKVLYHDKPVHYSAVADEAGDVLWYLCHILDQYSLTLDKVMTYNIAKLEKRHPGGQLNFNY